MAFAKNFTFSRRGGNRAGVVDDHADPSGAPAGPRASTVFEDDPMTRRSVLVDDDMDQEAFGKLINQGHSMRFQFGDDDDDDDRDEYNAEISVFPRNLEDALSVCKERAKEWSTSTLRLTTFLEKKLLLEMETYKSMSRSTRENLEFCSKEGFKGDGSYYKGVVDIFRSQELMCLKYQEFLGSVNKKVLEPLTVLRRDHEKSRKRLWTHFVDSQKKLVDTVALMEKAKAKYQKQAHTWEKAMAEKVKEKSTNYKVKLDKKVKEEDEAHHQAEGLEQQYRDQVRQANKALEEHKKALQLVLSAFERLLRQSDDKLKEFLTIYAELEEEFYTSLIPQAKESRITLSKIDDLYYLQQFIAKVSSGKTWTQAPYSFEKYVVESDASAPSETPKGLHK